MEIETSNLVGRLIVAYRRQIIHEKGLMRSREPFKFWRASTISWNGWS